VATRAPEGIARPNYRTLIEPIVPLFLDSERKRGTLFHAPGKGKADYGTAKKVCRPILTEYPL
jgi:hypothetical protein